jgi:hypothetical protein
MPIGSPWSTISTPRATSCRRAASANGNVRKISLMVRRAVCACSRVGRSGTAISGMPWQYTPVVKSYPSALTIEPSSRRIGVVQIDASLGSCHSPCMSRYILATRSGTVAGSPFFTGRENSCASLTTPCVVSGVAIGMASLDESVMRAGVPRL